MRPVVPDARWKEFLRAVQTQIAPTDPLALLAYSVYCRTEDDAVVEYACDLARNRDDRDVLVAFCLSGAEAEETSKSLRIPIEVLAVFEKLVIDMSTFRNKLDLLRYAQHYRTMATEKGSDLIELGVVQGPFALMHHFIHGHEELVVDAKMYARSMMQQSFYFGMLSRGNTIKSNVAKESLRWLSATASLLKDYDRILGDSHDSDEPLLEIVKRQSTKTPEELNITKGEILHGLLN